MNKKVIAIIAIFIIMLVGCSQGSNSEFSNGKEGKKNSSNEQVTIKFHHWYNTEDERLDIVIEEFEKRNPGINIESIQLDPANSLASMQALDLLAASGDQLDVIMMPDSSNYSQRVGMGLLEPLDPYLEKNNIDPKEEFIVNMSIDGAFYALPGKLSPMITIINKDLLDKAGLEVPKEWTFDEFLEYAKILTEGEGVEKQYGSFFIDMFPYTYTQALTNQKDENILITSDGKSNIKHEGVRKSLEILQQTEMKDKSVMPYSDRVSQNIHYAWPYFNQKAAMNIIGGYMISRVGGYETYPATFTTAFAPYPKNKKEDESYAPVEGDYITMAKTSKHKEESFKFIYFLATEGIILQEKYLTGWTKADLDQVVDNIISHTDKPEFVDGESLKQVLETYVPTNTVIPPPYYNEVNKVYTEQVELFLLGDQDIDTTIEKADEAVKRIIETNK